MDKVIIDGVDVSECKHFYSDEMCDNEQTLSCVCVKNKECEYKQLKRLQAENEQLKKSIDRIMQNKEIKTIDSEIALLNAELQQESKRLKARLRPLEDSYFKGLSSIEIAELAKKSIRITAENRKLEYALQEIRDIVSKIIDSYIRPYGDFDQLKTILDKINSVIGAEQK